MGYLITFEDYSYGYLSHHGIKGMKWGVWNAETAARYRGSLKTDGNFSGGGGRLPDEEYEGSDEDFPKKDREMSADEDMALINPLLKDLLKELGVKDMAELEKLDENDLLNRMQKLPNYSDKDIYQSIFKPSFYDVEGSSMNCATCSVIYDLRRRGYDIDANTTSNLAYELDFKLGELYKGASFKNVDSTNDLNSSLENCPDGSRGIIAGTTVSGGGHAVAWEKENGSVVYRDCQSNTKYSKDDIDQLFQSDTATSSSGLRWERLDDKPARLQAFKEKALTSRTGTSKQQRVKDAIKANKSREKEQVRMMETSEYFTERDIANERTRSAKARGKVVRLINERAK